MIIIGITGSIGCGKSTVASFFKRFNCVVLDADFIVLKLYKTKKIIKKIKNLNSSLVDNNEVNRKNLFNWIANDDKNRVLLENLIHAEVRKYIKFQLLKLRFTNPFSLVVLDIPLLFEANFSKMCKYCITVYCNDYEQEQRVMKRSNMSKEKFNYLKSKQFSQEKKKALADFVINTSLKKVETIKQVKTLVRYIKNEQTCNI